MTMTVAKSELREAMKGFSAFFGGRPKKEKCLVRLRDSGGVLNLTATDGDNWLTFRKPIKSDSDAVTDIVLSWAVLKRFAARSQSEHLSFIEISGVPGEVSVSDSIGSERHPRVPLSEWPSAPHPPKEFACVDEQFLRTLAKVAPFADREGVRASLKGVLIEPNWIVASDRLRLVRFPANAGVKSGAIIARHEFLESGVLQGDGDIGVNEQLHRITIRTAAWAFDAPEIQETYPNYKALIPDKKPFSKSVTFTQASAEKLIQALSRKAMSRAAIDPICFLFDGQNSLVTYRDGKNAVEVEIETTGETDTVITLNHPVPLEMLRLGLKTIRFDTPQAIMMAIGDDGGDMTLMPLTNSRPHEIREAQKTRQLGRETRPQTNNQPNNKQPQKEKTTMSEQQTRPIEQPKPAAENNGFKVTGAEKNVMTFEELIDYVNGVRLEAARLRDMVNSLPAKIRDAHRSVKEKEREYENARLVINRLRKVSGF